jgi:lipopolysaccharide/colanic/teichoic acid biosynthesis glycosyltransferase
MVSSTYIGPSSHPTGGNRHVVRSGFEPTVVRRQPIRLFRPGYLAIKRFVDLSLCIATLPVSIILLGTCALLVWIDDPGPVFFIQTRTGKGGKRFRMFKFRTMVKNAAELKHEYSHLNEQTGPDFKITDDPRVTRVGRFLRRTSLDELPQILNVIRGEMSIVGPRPTSFSMDSYGLWHTERLEVLPGLTGLWQVHGRSEVGFDDRVRLDIEYIENQSFWLDMSILLRTAEAVFSRRGAC